MKYRISASKLILILFCMFILAIPSTGVLTGCGSTEDISFDGQTHREYVDAGAEVAIEHELPAEHASKEPLTQKSQEPDAATIPQVRNFQAVDTIDGVKMIWTPVEGAEGYEIFHSTRLDKNYELIATQEGTYFALEEIPDSATNYFKVRAFGTMHGTVRYGHLSAPVSIPR